MNTSSPPSPSRTTSSDSILTERSPGKPAAAANPRAELELNALLGGLRIDDGGSGGIPIVLIHGLGSDRHVWDAELVRLRRSRRVLTWDLHGFGDSLAAPAAVFSPESYAAELLAILDACAIERAILVAHSYGGQVATAFAGTHPQRVVGIAYVDSVFDMTLMPESERRQFLASLRPESYKEVVRGLFSQMLTASAPGVKEQVLATLENVPREAYAAAAEGMFFYDPKPALARYAGPRFAIVAEGAQAEAPFAYHKLAGFPYQIMKGVSHWLMLDAPTEYARQLDAFLCSL